MVLSGWCDDDRSYVRALSARGVGGDHLPHTTKEMSTSTTLRADAIACRFLLRFLSFNCCCVSAAQVKRRACRWCVVEKKGIGERRELNGTIYVSAVSTSTATKDGDCRNHPQIFFFHSASEEERGEIRRRHHSPYMRQLRRD